MPISAKWKHKSSIHIGFIVFNGGVATFFAKSVWQHESSLGPDIFAEIHMIHHGKIKYSSCKLTEQQWRQRCQI